MFKKLLMFTLSLSLLFVSACSQDKKSNDNKKNDEVIIKNTNDNKDEAKEDNKKEDSSTKTDVTKNESDAKTPDNTDNLYEDKIYFTIEMENGGIMKGELYPNLAPKTVDNFVKLVNKNFYDGLIFHRVIEGFMIQGGGFDANMNPTEAKTIVGEFINNGYDNPLKHTKGVLSMARTMDPNSASSQFFIMHGTSPHLDGDYAAFGRITKGLDIIDEIATVDCETKQVFIGEQSIPMSDVPSTPQIIKTIKID